MRLDNVCSDRFHVELFKDSQNTVFKKYPQEHPREPRVRQDADIYVLLTFLAGVCFGSGGRFWLQ